MQQENLLYQKIFKFAIGGGIVTGFNIVLIFIMVDWWGWDTILLHNVANALAIELSVILSFFIYRLWIWTEGEWNIHKILLKEIPLFHVAAGSAIAARIIFIFPFLDYFSIDPKINTLAGGLSGAALNYIMNDRVVFKSDKTSKEPESFSEANSEE